MLVFPGQTNPYDAKLQHLPTTSLNLVEEALGQVLQNIFCENAAVAWDKMNLLDRINTKKHGSTKKHKNSQEQENLKEKNIRFRAFANFIHITLPETNSSPLKIGHPKRKLVFPTIHFQVLC